MAKHVVLLTGRAGSGKDTAALLCASTLRERGVRVASLAFADALRDVALRVVRDVWCPEADPRWFVDRDCKERALHELAGGEPLFLAGRPLTPRWLLQWLGTDVARSLIGDSVWVDALLARARRAADGDGDGDFVLFVTDMRFPNEAAAAPRLAEAVGGDAVRIRLVDPHAEPLPPDAHASERDIASLPVEAEIVNDKAEGLSALHGKVMDALTRLW